MISIVNTSNTLKVSEGLFFYANSAKFQLYHDENKLIFNEKIIMSAIPHFKLKDRLRELVKVFHKKE